MFVSIHCNGYPFFGCNSRYVFVCLPNNVHNFLARTTRSREREREERVFSLVKQIKFPSFPAHVCAPAFAGLTTMCAPAEGGRGGYESSRCGSLFTTLGFYAPPLTVERMCVLCACALVRLCLYARNLHASSQTTSGTRQPREDVRTAMTGTATIKTGSA